MATMRLRDLVETLRAAARAAQAARDEEHGYQPMPPVGRRGGQPARPPAASMADEDADEARPWRREPDLEPRAQPAPPTRRARIGRRLADPHALADAVVLREILGPPLALRGRNRGRPW